MLAWILACSFSAVAAYLGVIKPFIRSIRDMAPPEEPCRITYGVFETTGVSPQRFYRQEDNS